MILAAKQMARRRFRGTLCGAGIAARRGAREEPGCFDGAPFADKEYGFPGNAKAQYHSLQDFQRLGQAQRDSQKGLTGC
jgi:hypothetical protein